MYPLTLALALSLVAASRQAPPPAAATPVQCEFRVFDGADDLSKSVRIRVYPAGQRTNAMATDGTGRLALAPGLYDVQVIRERAGQVTALRWLEQLLVARYPDEQGRHLEVINFKPLYGALQLRGEGADAEVTAFAAGDRTKPIATGVPGADYVLLVVPGGRYDVRVRSKRSNVETWLPDIDVPADRTRLRTIRPTGGNPPSL